mgnify:CR=1 FL=1
MKKITAAVACLTVLAMLAGCATSTVCNPQATTAQAQLSEANYTVVKSGVKGDSQMTILGIRMLGGMPFGIVLSGDKDLVTSAMDEVREKAALEGAPRALVNVTQEMQYDPWVIIWHKVKMTVTADVVEFK